MAIVQTVLSVLATNCLYSTQYGRRTLYKYLPHTVTSRFWRESLRTFPSQLDCHKMQAAQQRCCKTNQRIDILATLYNIFSITFLTACLFGEFTPSGVFRISQRGPPTPLILPPPSLAPYPLPIPGP